MIVSNDVADRQGRDGTQSRKGGSKLNVIYTNADQLVNKRDDLCMTIAGAEPDIILITEAIPKAQALPIDPALLSIPGYSLFVSFDMSEEYLGRSGNRGICVFVRESCGANQVFFTEPKLTEHIWLEIKLRGNDKLTVGCVYRSPSVSPHMSVDELAHLFHAVLATNPTHLLIAGDFNLPQIDWTNSFCSAPENHHSHKFLDVVQECMLFQHVLQPTRYRDGEQPSILDLLMTCEEGMLTDLNYSPGLGKSDHLLLSFQLACYTVQAGKKPEQLNFHRANFREMNRLLVETDWSRILMSDIEDGYAFFKETLNIIISSCIPVAKHSSARRNIYMNSNALKLRKLKNQLWQRCTATNDPIDIARFHVCRNRLRKLTRHLRQHFESRLVSELKTNSKAFWRYANSRLKTKSGIGDLRDSNGEMVSGAEAKAQVLNSFFASVFTHESSADVPGLHRRAVTVELSDVVVTAGAVEQKLRALRVASSPGPDDIHPRVLKEAHSSLSLPLAYLFRRTLDTGCIPQDWTLARVVPIYKKGEKQKPSNYRPVSLTSVPCKILESLIRDQIMAHLVDHNLLSNHQHGFRPKRSCNTQLLEALDDWSRDLECGNPVDSVYLDFQKAFDSVPHLRLLKKLYSYGIAGKLLDWIASFLIGRRQQVVLEGSHSDWTEVASGVPQGSVLGPLLFIIYVNDLPDVIKSGIKLFADDAKLYRGVPSTGDAVLLQSDLTALSEWSSTWLMPFNRDKCKVLHIGHVNPRFSYTMDGFVLDTSSIERDLGVNIDEELKFREHASMAVAKATRVLAVIRRSFVLFDEVTLPMLYKTMVRPHLEYGNIIWGPFNRADQKLVERVQRRATRLVEHLRQRPYAERLRCLKLPSLYYRRRRGDMIFTYQLFHNGVDADPSKFFTLADSTTRGHPFKLRKSLAATRVRRFSFASRIINDWNSLPSEVVCAPSLDSFKSRLDAHWSSIWYEIPYND